MPTSTYLRDWFGGEVPAGESILPPEWLHVSSSARPDAEFAVGLIGLGTTLALFRLFGPGWGTASLLFLPGPLQLRTARELVARRRFEASHRNAESLASVSVTDLDSIGIVAAVDARKRPFALVGDRLQSWRLSKR